METERGRQVEDRENEPKSIHTANGDENDWIEASAPGKIILAGDHAVVHGKPAILAAVNLRCRAKLLPRSDNQIEIISSQISERSITTSKEIVEKTILARKVWEEFHKTNSKELLKQITPKDLDLVEIGIGEMFLTTAKRIKTGFTLIIESDIPVGAGLGSSASVAASVIKALDKFLDTRLSKEQLNNIVYETEKKKHGASSGVDVAAAVYGNLLWFRKETDFLRVVTPLNLNGANILKNITLIMTGRPEASTGETVRFVMEMFKKSPASVQAVFDEIEFFTKDILHALHTNDQKRLLDSLNNCGDQLEKLGVVPPAAKAIINQVRNLGGAAKITGAGSLGGEKVGTILAIHPEPAGLENTLSRMNLRFQSVEISSTGAS